MIVIIGAGIAGLSLGDELVRRGEAVTVVEGKADIGGAAKAATAYLEPRLGNTPLRWLEWQALNLWPAWAADLQAQSGIDIDFRQDGQIRLATEASAAWFEKDLTARQAQDWTLETLNRDEILGHWPDLSVDVTGGVFLPQIAWLNPLAVCRALAKRFLSNGGTLLTGWPAKTMEQTPQGLRVIGPGDELTAETIVLASAMGTNDLAGLPATRPTVRPVRGVNLLLDMANLSVPPRQMIKHHRGSLCPRSDSTLIVGTTYEPGATSEEVSDAVVERVLANAETVAPFIRDLPLLQVVSGTRSKIGDGTMLLARSDDMPGLYYSLSHAGAGFLRAPIAARLMADLVLN